MAGRPKLLIVTGIFPPDHGGPSTYVPMIAEALAESFEILAVVTGSDSARHDDNAYPYPVVRIRRSTAKLIRLPRTILHLSRLARTADVVYLNGMVLEGIVACKLLRRRPVVVKVVGDRIWEIARNIEATHDTIEAFQRKRPGLKWWLLHKLQGWYTARADRVIVPSNYLGRIVSGWGVPSCRIVCIYNASRLQSSPADGAEKSYDIVTVCRLVPWKGLEPLVDAAVRGCLSARIVGDGSLRDALDIRIRRHGAENSIILEGAVPQDEIFGLLRRARIFVLNSSYEGLPHVVLEAMAAGTPVIATDVGGTGEVVLDGKTGILIPVGDVAALTAAIARLLEDDSLRARLVGNAHELIEEQFSLDTMCRRTSALLMKLAE